MPCATTSRTHLCGKRSSGQAERKQTWSWSSSRSITGSIGYDLMRSQMRSLGLPYSSRIMVVKMRNASVQVSAGVDLKRNTLVHWGSLSGPCASRQAGSLLQKLAGWVVGALPGHGEVRRLTYLYPVKGAQQAIQSACACSW